jgi:hypothetical protein
MAKGEVTGKDLLEVVKELQGKIIALMNKTAAEVEVLRRATEIINGQKESWWHRLRPLIASAAFLLVLFGAMAVGRTFHECGLKMSLTELSVQYVTCEASSK